MGGILHLSLLLSVLVSCALDIIAINDFSDREIISFQRVANKSPFNAAVYFWPWIVGGLLFAMISGLMLHIIPGRWLLAISGVSKAVALLFFALMPEDPNYWQWIFPAMVFETACVDVLWTVSNVYLTTNLPREQQGLAGALINFTLFIGSAFSIGIADIASAELKKTEMPLKDQYQSIFWLGFGIACVALVIALFIKLGRAGSRLTAEEEAALQAKASLNSVDTFFSRDSGCLVHERYATEAANVPASTIGTDHIQTEVVPAAVETGYEKSPMEVTEYSYVQYMGDSEKTANVVVCEILEDQTDMSDAKKETE